MIERPVLPHWEPEWAQRHPWLWALINGLVQGTIAAGLARYSGEATEGITAAVGIGWGVVAAVLARVFVTRQRKIPKNGMFDPRGMPPWLQLVTSAVLLLVFAAPIIDGFVDGNALQIAWAVELIAFFIGMGVTQRSWLRRIKADAALMSYGTPSYYPYPPVPPPRDDRPPPLPPASDA
jgi:hypothetical protein